MAAIYAAAGYDVHCTDGRVLEGSRHAEDALREELHEEFREQQKGVAKRFLQARDISCDNIANVLGLSVHTVRGMSRKHGDGDKNYRGKIERTEMSYEEIQQQVEW